MLIETPLHPRTGPANATQEWRDWNGYLGAACYHPSLDLEYWAVRNGVGLMDVSPLYKYEVVGPDASHVLDRMVTRDLGRLEVSRVAYTPWCDDDGKVVDDGTVVRLARDRYRLTAADPTLAWLGDCAEGMAAEVLDRSEELAALAVQGPRAAAVLGEVLAPAATASLGYFRHGQGAIAGAPVEVTRTGYTGDLGFELWMAADQALTVWDALVEAGSRHGLLPVGLAALDVLRLEAGYVLAQVDYQPARMSRSAGQMSSPYEIGLGWAVALDKKRPFVGQSALRAAKAGGGGTRLIGIEVDWVAVEQLYAAADLPPQVTGRVHRGRLPLYADDVQIGYATSLGFSPIGKRLIGLGHVFAVHAKLGNRLDCEITVEGERRTAAARIVERPFFDPPQRRG